MGATIAHIAKTPEMVQMEHISALIEGLKTLSKIMDNPKLIKQWGESAAAAIALTEPEQKARDEAIAYLEKAEVVKEAIAKEYETLGQKRQDVVSEKNRSILEINDHRKRTEAALKARESTLAEMQENLARDLNAVAAREQAMREAEAEDVERKRELLNIEARIQPLLMQIEATKNALKAG